MSVTLDWSRLQTPSRNRDILIEPAGTSFEELVESNQARFAEYNFTVCGVDFFDYRQSIRQDLGLPPEGPVIVLGHQPEFYHCGVWAKGVVGKKLAGQLGGVNVNVVIDHDQAKEKFLQVPYTASGQVRVSHIPLDARQPTDLSGTGPAWYEELPVWNAEVIQNIARQVRETPDMNEELSLLPALLEGFTRARAPKDWVSQYSFAMQWVDRLFDSHSRYVRSSEIDWGCFLAEMICHSARFAASYNKALATYRREHRIKGSRHPIPDLQIDGRRIELPVWIWDSNRDRQRMYVSESAGQIELFCGGQHVQTLHAAGLADLRKGSAQLDELVMAHRIRPRALTFTMWARLFLGDFFIHGIGGAKYDQITDLIIRDYFAVQPPAYGCVSASMWLDLPRYEVGRDDLRSLKWNLRDIFYNPQRHVMNTVESKELISQRRQLVHESERLSRESPRDRSARKKTYQEIRNANRLLEAYCEGPLYESRKRLSALDWQLKNNTLANAREYFYCLFSKSQLMDLKSRLESGSSAA